MTTTAPALPALAADAVGGVSVTLGGLLAVAPATGGRRLGLLADRPGHVRALGLADLGLGLAIVAGRWVRPHTRWQAVGLRSLLHLGFAREYVRAGHRPAAAGMMALMLTDSAVTLALATVPSDVRQ